MHFKHNTFASLSTIALGAVLALGFLSNAKAEDKKSDASGTWTWTTPGRNGGPDRKMSLKLKIEGDKVTGTLTSPGRNGQSNESEVQDGKLTGDQLTFTVTREFNGNKMTTKYTGTLSGDSLKGKMEFDRNGEPTKRDWEATRAAARTSDAKPEAK